MALLASIVCWSDKVQWDVVSVVIENNVGWLERLDRFWMDGEEYSVACNGIFTIDPATQTVLSVRDYVDLGEWRSRVGPVLADFSRRSPDAVVQRHRAAVERLDPVTMAADYALNAVLERPGACFESYYAIADYFDSVPSRLAGRKLTFGPMEAIGSDRVKLSWRITRVSMPPYQATIPFRLLRAELRIRSPRSAKVTFNHALLLTGLSASWRSCQQWASLSDRSPHCLTSGGIGFDRCGASLNGGYNYWHILCH